MNKVSDYTKKVNVFGRSLSKMLLSDFPDDVKLLEKVDELVTRINFLIMASFLEKGGKS